VAGCTGGEPPGTGNRVESFWPAATETHSSCTPAQRVGLRPRPLLRPLGSAQPIRRGAGRSAERDQAAVDAPLWLRAARGPAERETRFHFDGRRVPEPNRVGGSTAGRLFQKVEFIQALDIPIPAESSTGTKTA